MIIFGQIYLLFVKIFFIFKKIIIIIRIKSKTYKSLYFCNYINFKNTYISLSNNTAIKNNSLNKIFGFSNIIQTIINKVFKYLFRLRL